MWPPDDEELIAPAEDEDVLPPEEVALMAP